MDQSAPDWSLAQVQGEVEQAGKDSVCTGVAKPDPLPVWSTLFSALSLPCSTLPRPIPPSAQPYLLWWVFGSLASNGCWWSLLWLKKAASARRMCIALVPGLHWLAAPGGGNAMMVAGEYRGGWRCMFSGQVGRMQLSREMGQIRGWNWHSLHHQIHTAQHEGLHVCTDKIASPKVPPVPAQHWYDVVVAVWLPLSLWCTGSIELDFKKEQIVAPLTQNGQKQQKWDILSRMRKPHMMLMSG